MKNTVVSQRFLIIICVTSAIVFAYMLMTHFKKEDVAVASLVKCEAYIESINGVSPVPAVNEAKGFLSVTGWLVPSAKEDIATDIIFIKLTDQHGKKIYFETQRFPRPDVQGFLNQQNMADPGFAVDVDVSDWVTGDYMIGLSYKSNNKLNDCEQMGVPVHITGR